MIWQFSSFRYRSRRNCILLLKSIGFCIFNYKKWDSTVDSIVDSTGTRLGLDWDSTVGESVWCGTAIPCQSAMRTHVAAVVWSVCRARLVGVCVRPRMQVLCELCMPRRLSCMCVDKVACHVLLGAPLGAVHVWLYPAPNTCRKGQLMDNITHHFGECNDTPHPAPLV